MRFGVCAGMEKLQLLASAGWDFIEPGVAGQLQPERHEAEVLPGLLAAAQASTIAPETYNGFLPPNLKVVGPEVDLERQNLYLAAACKRAAALGGRLIVFGSGGARQIPEGFAEPEAHRQIVDFLRRSGEAAGAANLVVAIEPLSRAECNHITSVGEASALALEVNHPSVAVLADLYHITSDGQNFDETRAAGAALQHVHVAGAEGRRAPVAADKEFLSPFFRVLKDINYGGRISVEGSWADLESDAEACLQTLREAWAAA